LSYLKRSIYQYLFFCCLAIILRSCSSLLSYHGQCNL
jgi:hypothetical protein